MPTKSEAVALDWTRPIVKHFPDREVQVGDVTVFSPETWVVTAGEYADQGEPDLIVSVSLAVDREGNDISARIAGVVRDALERFADRGGV